MPDLKRILLVEDEADLRTVTAFRLRKAGFEVVPAATGDEALRLAFDQTPDVILLDLNIPGVSGPEVGKRLKSDARTKSIPLLIFSASRESIDSAARDIGAEGLVIKPYDPLELVEQIRQLIHLRTDPGPTSQPTRRDSFSYDPDMKEFYDDFIRHRRKEVSEWMVMPHNAIDFRSLYIFGHQVRGGGGLTGISEIAEIGEAIEGISRSQDVAGFPTLLARLSRILDTLEAKVREHQQKS